MSRLGAGIARDWLTKQIWPIEPVAPADEKKAKEIIQHYTDQEFSFTDATSFTVMERLGVPAAFALDAHFKQYGLKFLAWLAPMIVELRRKNARHQDLTAGLSYVVIGIEADDYRILNDQGLPYLYPSRLFQIIDSSKPRDWIIEGGEEGESYAYPQPLNAVGFFEDFFDAKPKAVVTFWRVVNQRLVSANQVRPRTASSS